MLSNSHTLTTLLGLFCYKIKKKINNTDNHKYISSYMLYSALADEWLRSLLIELASILLIWTKRVGFVGHSVDQYSLLSWEKSARYYIWDNKLLGQSLTCDHLTDNWLYSRKDFRYLIFDLNNLKILFGWALILLCMSYISSNDLCVIVG
jgi:hypothetical protein